VGQGSCFTLIFPTFEEPRRVSEVKTEAKPAPAPQQGSGVILLVEDEAPVRAFAARALRLRGYTVIEAETAEDALEILSDDTLDIDVFVTDVVMPGMDGPTWVSMARQDRPDVKVVFVSGYAEDVFGDGPTSIANSVFLPKPFSLSELTETVRRQFA
jgi:two-component system cell cycle sensor histidine kinase/response regulator CckA